MGFISALTSKCRTVREVDTGNKVYGEPEKETVVGPWIRCRLEDTGASGSSTDDDSRIVFRRRPNLMINRVDIRGKPVDLNPGEQIEILSRDHGNGMWRIEGAAKRITKRVGTHHFEANVVQVIDGQAGEPDEEPVEV